MSDTDLDEARRAGRIEGAEDFRKRLASHLAIVMQIGGTECVLSVESARDYVLGMPAVEATR